MAFLGSLSAAFGFGPRSELGDVTSPRRVSLEVAVAPDVETMTSPFSGSSCAYFHGEVGEEVPVADLSGRVVRLPFFASLAELRSDQDLVVMTDDARRITLARGFFLVVAETFREKGSRLASVPEGIAGVVAAAQSRGRLAYHEVVLRPGDRVAFSGIVEAIRTSERADYRRAPRFTYRMRPEREPIIVQKVA